ncbi:universal stress protein [Halobaculum sp. EA56]|uniref:universal stress protein n=1 Tax=Halobaculum sp. EA56 TaxID=3421648 RepID=UPI003EB839D1
MTVLIAIDGEEGSGTVVAEGVELASRLDEEPVVLHVASGSDLGDAERAAESVVADAVDDPDTVTLRIVEGNPAERVLNEIEETGPDYAVLGSSKRTPAGKVVFGSVLQLVMRGSDVPVVTVPQDRE